MKTRKLTKNNNDTVLCMNRYSSLFFLPCAPLTVYDYYVYSIVYTPIHMTMCISYTSTILETAWPESNSEDCVRCDQISQNLVVVYSIIHAKKIKASFSEDLVRQVVVPCANLGIGPW